MPPMPPMPHDNVQFNTIYVYYKARSTCLPTGNSSTMFKLDFPEKTNQETNLPELLSWVPGSPPKPWRARDSAALRGALSVLGETRRLGSDTDGGIAHLVIENIGI